MGLYGSISVGRFFSLTLVMCLQQQGVCKWLICLVCVCSNEWPSVAVRLTNVFFTDYSHHSLFLSHCTEKKTPKKQTLSLYSFSATPLALFLFINRTFFYRPFASPIEHLTEQIQNRFPANSNGNLIKRSFGLYFVAYMGGCWLILLSHTHSLSPNPHVV